ncbi:LmeA family phospholipid-binding protein [Actinoplanes sp. NPDC026623]|uniref:LmeA family phospholipid-binding protein n=1 Tax=Actinoplanes sp. NPDC026623 TaxID=3155610 RepID=UPI0033EB3D02
MLLLLPGVALLLPSPYLDGPLGRLIAGRVANQVSCPDDSGPAPQITIRGSHLVRQALRRRLTEVGLVQPDTTVGGVSHATVVATMRDVTQPAPDTVHVGGIEATITTPFANMSAPPDGSRPTFGRASNGLLTVQVTAPAKAVRNVRSTLFFKLNVTGETLHATPRQLQVFGKTISADQVASVTGGVRSQKLPALPDGMNYKSVTPRSDGLHVALGGVATTAFAKLPARVDGQHVTYSAKRGRLAISTAKDIPLLGAVPLTIFTAPTVEGNTLKLVPRKVRVLGGDYSPHGLIGGTVLSLMKRASLSRALPALPSGVRYRGASVDAGGLKVSLGGVTVKPYSELPATDEEGRATRYGARSGLMTVTVRGNSRPAPIVLYAKPAITGSTLDLVPRQIRMFGVLFPARNVLAQVTAGATTYPLPPLPAGLAYGAVDVQPDGLRLHLSGEDATLSKGMLGWAGC